MKKNNQELLMNRISVMTKLKLTSILLTMMIALCAELTWASDISKEIYQKIDTNYFPALCKIEYSIEITNTNTGEKNRRASYTQGIMVSEDGLILAHGHMVLENRKPLNIKVTVGTGDDEEEYDATFLTKPDDINITFLRLKNDEDIKFPFLKFDTNTTLELGDPFLLTGLLNQNFDYAKIIQSHRIGAVLTDPRLTYTVDSSITFGFIGGPAFNASGSPIGVVGFDLSRNEGGEIYTRSGYPLVFQSSLFQKYIDNPPSEEELNSAKDDAYLGVFTQPLTEDFSEYWKLPNDGGIIISTVIGGSPAHKAGFKSGDVISNFNGTDVTAKQNQDVVSFTKMVRESPINVPLPIKFYRAGEALELKLTLTTRPTAGKDANVFEDEVFGITARELTTDVRIQLNLGEDVQGVIISAIKSGSPASLARLRRNYVIQAIGELPVRNLEEFQQVLTQISKDKPQEIPVFCRVGANTAFFRMKPRWTE
jgi:serine protease Do